MQTLLALLCFSSALIINHAQDAVDVASLDMTACVANYKEVMKNAEAFITKFMSSKMTCMEKCKETVAPIKSCMMDAHGMEGGDPEEMGKAMMMIKGGMFKKGMQEVMRTLESNPKCQAGGAANFQSLKEALQGTSMGPVDHLFEGKHCKMPALHAIMPEEACTCVGECMVEECLKDPEMGNLLTEDNLKAKIEWLSDPENNPMPAVVAQHDIMSAGLCFVNNCGMDVVRSTIEQSGGLAQFSQMQRMMKKMMMNGEVAGKMNSFCECVQSISGKTEPACMDIPKLIGMAGGMNKAQRVEKCISLKKSFMEDFLTYFQNVQSQNA